MTLVPLTLDELNALPAADFALALDGVFENAPWVAAAAAGRRPFPTVAALHEALFAVAEAAPEEGKRAFLQGHPDLAGTAARQRAMGEHSTAEQAALGLDRLDEAGFARFAAMNEEYRGRFGFPFMLCVRRHTLPSLLEQFERRLREEPEAEMREAFRAVFLITRLRLARLVRGPGMPVVAGSLSVHVLDTARGCPGVGIAVSIHELGAGEPVLRGTGITDANGWVPDLLDDGGPLRIGTYELRFGLGAYFAASGLASTDPAYLDVLPIRASVSDPESSTRISLLASPYGCTTYQRS